MTDQQPSLLDAPDQVLSTLNKDGSRRWLHPKLSPGRFLVYRRVVAYGLIGFFVALPWFKINGMPPILLDIPEREFTFFGKTFLSTDTLLLMLLLASMFVMIFLITALFGRLWCGWACPQTVYMEFVYRPLERLFDGPATRRKKQGGSTGIRRVLKFITYLIVSLVIAHIFLAYFVGVEELFQWVQHSPFDHPTAFLVMAAVTGLMMFDFCFFREQTCIVACPYGRFQSVMLDSNSLIISYDEKRGEPRGKKRRAPKTDDPEATPLPQLGDCIDCHMCVTTCPTGIDIRRGLQMECIGCAQCIDACDAVMDKIKRPRGLIRYSSEEAMATGRKRFIRPRVVIYPIILLIFATLFTFALATKSSADITIMRSSRLAYQTMPDGRIRNDIQVKIVNRSETTQTYALSITGIDGAELDCDACPVTIEPGEMKTVDAYILTSDDCFELGRANVTIEINDGAELDVERTYRIQGPLGSANPTSTEDSSNE